jgi:subtilase family serine protease
MEKRVLIAVIAGLFLLSASVSMAGESPPTRTATPPLHIKGPASTKSAGPNYLTGYGYNPTQIKAAYGISGTGAGQTIAIVDAYGSPTIYEDVATFCQTYGLAQANLTIYYPSGMPMSYDAGWAMETSLDVEWAHALAPMANIALVIAPSATDTDLFAAVQYAAQNLRAQVVSMSWGATEYVGETVYDSYLQRTGTVFVAATGDSGSGVQYPAASPNVVAVGGTALYLIANTGVRKFPEVAWEGAGGGVSTYEPIPSYQTQLGIQAKGRCVPDLGFVADPNTGVLVYNSNYDPATNGWWTVGGTSLATPCWAAVIALANQVRVAAGRLALTDGHQALYNLAMTPASYQQCYLDITMGYNGDYAAGTGFDYITGLGCPKTVALIQGLKNAQH